MNGNKRALCKKILLPPIVLVCLAGWLATFACLGAKGWWRLELACHFRLQYVVLFLVATPLLFLMKYPKWATLMFVGALLHGATLFPFYLSSPNKIETGIPFRILSANVLSSNQQVGPMLEMIDETHPDAFFVLELSPPWEEALKEIESEYPYQKVISRNDNFGMGLYSRHPLEEVVVYDLMGVPAIVAEADLNGERVMLVGIHPLPPTSSQYAAIRDEQLRQLVDIIKMMEGKPVVMIGDFNTTSTSPIFREVVTQTGLTDSRIGYGIQGTWPGPIALLRIPIDHCLVSHNVGVNARRVERAIGSDHRPILIDLQLPISR